ncbi:MAG: RNA polymerase sigma-70 factor [Tannerella sp.]|nr:RNA polymerase sigma-70 factor [Tannerella sp.]
MTALEKNEIYKDFEQLYNGCFSKMKHFAKTYVLSDEDAENIVQDVFMEFWEKKELFMTHRHQKAFLFAAVKNRSLNHLRRQMIEQQAAEYIQETFMRDLRMSLDSLQVLDQNLFSEQDIEQIASRALLSLPEKCREIWIRSRMEGQKQKDIAAELNISVHTVETQIGIAYRKLKAELQKYLSLLVFLLSLQFY